MTEQYPELTTRQLATVKALTEIKISRHDLTMKWIILIVMLLIVVALTCSFIVLIFAERKWGAAAINGAIDGVFGACFWRAFSSLFPSNEIGPARFSSSGKSD